MSERVGGAGDVTEGAREVVTAGRTITESDLVAFASLTGDWHPQHADAEWAADGHFGARVAHGMLLLSYAVGLLRFDPERVVALRGLDSIAFKRPVMIGDTIRVVSRVESRRGLDAGHELVTFAWRILNQDGRLVARARVKALCRAEPHGADAGAGANGGPSAMDDLYGDRLAL